MNSTRKKGDAKKGYNYEPYYSFFVKIPYHFYIFGTPPAIALSPLPAWAGVESVISTAVIGV